MAPEAAQSDQDWIFLDSIISLCDEQSRYCNSLKEAIDDPEILKEVMALESNALILWKIARDYRQRLRLLKKMADGNGLEILNEISSLAIQIRRLANGVEPPLTTNNGSSSKKKSGSPLSRQA